MDLKLITVALDPATGGFREDPLAGIEAEPLSVAEHFFHHDGHARLQIARDARPTRAAS